MDNKVYENDKMEVYAKECNIDALDIKVGSFAKVMGGDVLYMGLLLKEMFLDISVPLVCKAPIAIGIGYLIMPADLIPDTIPIAGFVDDGVTIKGILKSIKMQIRNYHKEKAIAGVKRFLKLNDREATTIMAHIDAIL